MRNILMKFPPLVTAVTASVMMSPPTKDHYSACYPDRGYTKPDATEAAAFLWQNATWAHGLPLTAGDCIYKHVNTTVVSLCNGDARNRTVYQQEVKRGVEQLMTDCGAGGSSNGVHVINNLTFAAYGVYGGRSLAIPPGSNPPDLPGGTGRRAIPAHLRQKRDGDNCALFAYDGIPRTNCPHTYNLNTDGSCGPLNPGNSCKAFCETNRTGFLGVESNAPGTAGDVQPPGLQLALAEGIEVSITNGFSIGVEGVLKEVIGLGVNYEWSETITTTKSVQRSVEINNDFSGRWVTFPKYIESCGWISQRKYVDDIPTPCGPGCIPITKPRSCEGDVTTVFACTMVPEKINGEGQVMWAYRWENGNGTIVPVWNNSASYRSLCTQDSDGENECPLAPKRSIQLR